MADEPGKDSTEEPAATPATAEEGPKAAAEKPAVDATAAQEPEPEPEPEPHPVTAALTGRFGDRISDEGEDQCGTPIVRTGADDLTEVMTWLRDGDLKLNHLSSVTAVDYTTREPRFDIVYHLYALGQNHRLTMKCGCADGEGVPSMVDIWPAADWLERETYDLYGTEFLGHPDLRRIFLPEDWEGFPLRKDYPLEGPNLELLTRQQAAFRGGQFDRIRGEQTINEQEREMAGPGVVGALWVPEPPDDENEAATADQEGD